MVHSRVCATKRVATAPTLTILVMLPHVPFSGVLPFGFFFVFGEFLGMDSVLVGDGQDVQIALPKIFSYGGTLGSNGMA